MSVRAGSPNPFSARRLAVAGIALAIAHTAAFAQAIDLTKPFGNVLGCTNRDKQVAGDDQDSVYITQNALVTAGTACNFVQTLTGADGTLVITALCTIEGEEGRSINQISVVKSKSNAAGLAVYDEYGALLSEVTPCP